MDYTNKNYAVFHVGRGGRFHNSEILEFIGEMTIREMEVLCMDDLFSTASINDEAFVEWFNSTRREEAYLRADIQTRKDYGVTGAIFLEAEYSIGDADERETAREAARYYGEELILENVDEREAILSRLFSDMDWSFESLYEREMEEALNEFNEKYNTKWFDQNGNEVGEKGGAFLDFDGAYDTLYARDVDDLTEAEIAAIKREGMYISEELREACGAVEINTKKV